MKRHTYSACVALLTMACSYGAHAATPTPPCTNMTLLGTYSFQVTDYSPLANYGENDGDVDDHILGMAGFVFFDGHGGVTVQWTDNDGGGSGDFPYLNNSDPGTYDRIGGCVYHASVPITDPEVTLEFNIFASPAGDLLKMIETSGQGSILTMEANRVSNSRIPLFAPELVPIVAPTAR